MTQPVFCRFLVYVSPCTECLYIDPGVVLLFIRIYNLAVYISCMNVSSFVPLEKPISIVKNSFVNRHVLVRDVHGLSSLMTYCHIN
jgi:hypothetical protein